MKNKMSWIWILLLVIGLVLSSIIGWNLGKRREETISPQGPTAVLKKLEGQVRSKVALQSAASPLPRAAAGELADAARVNLLQDSFRKMFELREVFPKEKLRSEQLARLAQAPANLALAQNALVEIEQTRERFGADQALARVYSIKLLKAAADKGDESYLLDTIRTLARDLDEQVKAGRTIDSGRARDLEDLVRAFVSLRDVSRLTEEYGEQTMESAVARLAGECGFSKGYSERIGKIFANELFYYLQHSYDMDKAGQLVEASTGIRYYGGKKQA